MVELPVDALKLPTQHFTTLHSRTSCLTKARHRRDVRADVHKAVHASLSSLLNGSHIGSAIGLHRHRNTSHDSKRQGSVTVLLKCKRHTQLLV